MSEGKDTNTEAIQDTADEGAPPQGENSADKDAPPAARRRIFTRRNLVFVAGITAILLVLGAGLLTVLYQTGYTDNFIKRQFTAKMADFGMVFEADVFRVTVAPLQLELKNATFKNKLTGERLFRIGRAVLGLTIEDLYAWQLSRDIRVDTTEIEDFEAWVEFDENGESNFRGIDLAGPSVVNYQSVRFSMTDGIVHFGDVSRKVSGDIENVRFRLEPVDYDVPDEEKRYQFEFTSDNSDVVYDGRRIEPVGISARGIADGRGAEITRLKITAPLGESVLKGEIKNWQAPKYKFDIESTVDLTRTSNVLPLGTAIRGVGRFKGTVTGEGEKYRVEGEVNSEALAAENIRLKALKVAATVAGENATYRANGRAVAELLTFEDFKIDYPQLIGNIRGTGTDFRWVGELQAAALKSPLGTLGGLYITDAFAEYEDSKLSAVLGNFRAKNFALDETEINSLRAGDVRINAAGERVRVSVPQAGAERVRLDGGTELRQVAAGGITAESRGRVTEVGIDSLRAGTLRTGTDTTLRDLAAADVNIKSGPRETGIVARRVRAESLRSGGTDIRDLTAAEVETTTRGNETVVYSNGLRVARIDTDSAVLGSLNVGGVRLTIREGVIEGTTADIDAGDVTLKESAVAGGGRVENVRINKPVFVVEPSGRYRATADMSIGGGILGSVRLGNARAAVVAESDQIRLNELRAEVMDGRLDGDAVIALDGGRRSELKGRFENLDLSKMLALSGGRVVPLEGKTTGRIDLTFAGTDLGTTSGTVEADITAAAGSGERGLVPVNGNLVLNARNGLFEIGRADLFTEKTRLGATGSFDLGGYDSNLNIAVNSSDAGEIERLIRVLDLSPELEQQLDEYRAELAGNFTFDGTLRGKLDDPVLDGRAALDSLILRGRNLGSLTADIFVSPAEGITVRDGLLKEPGADGGTLAFNAKIPAGGRNNISIEAELNKINTGNLLAALPFEILPAGIESFEAQTSGRIRLSGLPNEMRGEAEINSGRGTINGEPFDGFRTRATFTGNQITLEDFTGQFGDGTLRAKGVYETDSGRFDFDAAGENVDLARVRPFIPKNRQLPRFTGQVDLTARVRGIAGRPQTFDVAFRGTGKDVLIDGRRLGEVAFQGTTENQRLTADLTTRFRGAPQVVTATVNFADENLPFTADTYFDQTELAPILALIPNIDAVDVEGRATGRVFITGRLARKNAAGEIEYTVGDLEGTARFSQLALRIQDTPLVASEPVTVRFNTDEVVFDRARFEGGGSNLVVSGTKALTPEGINNLSVDGKINLRILNAISANAFFTGIADLAVRLTGVDKNARLNGEAVLQNASVAAFIGSDRLNVDRIKGRIIFTSNQAQIAELTGFLGGGRITASGGALVEGLQLERFRLDVRGNNITAPLPPDFVTTGNADIEISGYRNRETNEMKTLIRGTINAKRSVYTDDIDLADIVGNRRPGSLSQGASGASSSLFGIPQLDIRIEGRDFLVIRNNLADLTASASLRVTGDVEFPQITGRVLADSGTVFFRNDRYQVQRATIEFQPNTTGIEPIINLQAETEIKGYQIIIGLSGNVTEPDSLQATFRSNPALPQPDVVSLITTGNLANTDSGIPTYARTGINTAAELLTDSLINNPASRATDKLFGLNRFELDPIVAGTRSGPTARLTVGRQINRNLLITYSTNLSEDQNQVVALEYRVSNRLSFVAQYEQTKISNVTRDPNVFRFEVRLRKRF